jgi:hypothetical protein
MKNRGMIIWMATVTLFATAQAFPQNQTYQGQGQAVVTVLPKVDGVLPSSVTNQDLSVKVNGKNAKVTKWAPFQSPNNSLELVLLIDGSARNSLGLQMDDMAHFIKSLPPNTKAAIAYMEEGSAVFSGPLSSDHAQVLRALHLPAGSPGSNASPYFCLSDLAKRWPSQDRAARREVVMVTDGVDNYDPQYDPEDPYVQAAMTDAARAGLVVYSIYWKNQGRFDQSFYANYDGQNLLSQVTQATGGKSFWEGMGNPISFEPYFDELTRRLRNQYELGFVTRLDGKPEVEKFKLELRAPGTEVDAPQQVIVFPVTPAMK